MDGRGRAWQVRCASRAEVTSEAGAKTLAGYCDGQQITSFREGDTSIPIAMRALSQDRDRLDQVRTIEIPSSSSAVPLPLMQLASFRANPQTSRIRRFNQQRAVTLSGKHPGMTSADLYEAMRPKLDSMIIPDGFVVTIEGEIKDR